MSKRVLSVALTSLVLAGCVPAAEKYQRIEADGARYFHSICQGGYGPQSVVYYPYHGIFISLSISNHIALGLHLPEGMTTQLNEEVVHIAGVTESGPVNESFPLRAVPQGALGTINPSEFVGMRDPFSSPLNFGPLVGATEKGRYIWYLFIAETASEPRAARNGPAAFDDHQRRTLRVADTAIRASNLCRSLPCQLLRLRKGPRRHYQFVDARWSDCYREIWPIGSEGRVWPEAAGCQMESATEP